MPHPAVLACAARTAEASREFFVIDSRFAASECESVERILRSREVIAQSRLLLDELKDAHHLLVAGTVSNASIISTSWSVCRSRSVTPAASATLSVWRGKLLLCLLAHGANKNPAEWPGRGPGTAATAGEETRLRVRRCEFACAR